MNSRRFDSISVGEQLGEYPLALTVQRMVMEAGANRDFAPIHCDPDLARASGAPNIYANNILLQGLVEATIRSWLGPDGKVRRLSLAMRQFNLPGQVVVGGGEVTAVTVVDGQGVVDLAVWTETGGVRTTEGTASVVLARDDA